VEGAISYLRQKGHFSAKSAKGHFTCRTRRVFAQLVQLASVGVVDQQGPERSYFR
jgi:hypothetical protein